MAGSVEWMAEARRVARGGGLELVLPECEKGLGAVILKVDSPQLIDGVRVEPVAVWPDDRGYFLEIQRLGQGLARAFPAASTQISAACN